MKMKKIFFVLVLLLFILALIPVGNAAIYTYDGEFDPAIFDNWEKKDKGVCAKGHYHFTVINPDKDSDVKVVEVLSIVVEGRYVMMAYRYFKGFEEYLFALDPSKIHYEQLLPENKIEFLKEI